MDMTWLDLWKFHGAALLAGCVIDWIIGDPLWLPHPVRLMGTMIAGMESRLRQRSGGMGKKGQFRAGAILTVSMCIIWWCVPWAAVHWAEQLCKLNLICLMYGSLFKTIVLVFIRLT